MTVGDLKETLEQIKDNELPVMIPVITKDDCDVILGFRDLSMARILNSGIEGRDDRDVLCLCSANDDGMMFVSLYKFINEHDKCKKQSLKKWEIEHRSDLETLIGGKR